MIIKRMMAIGCFCLAATLQTIAATNSVTSSSRLAGEYLADFAPPGQPLPPMWAEFTADGNFLLLGDTGTYATNSSGQIIIEVNGEPSLTGKVSVGIDTVRVSGTVAGETVDQKYYKPSDCRAQTKQLQGQWEYSLKATSRDKRTVHEPDLVVSDDTLRFAWRGELLNCTVSEGTKGQASIATDKSTKRVLELYVINDTLVLWERSTDGKVRQQWGFLRFDKRETK